MNLFHSLEEHAHVFYDMVLERLHLQVHSFGGADATLQSIADTLKEHLMPETTLVLPEVVAAVEAVVEPVIEAVVEAVEAL